MISVLSTTNKYILQPSLLDMHHQSLDWLSTTLFWKRELAFFQKLLDQYASFFTSTDDKKKIDHFQNLIMYYSAELIDSLRDRLHEHENRLAESLKKLNEADTEYYTQHQSLMEELTGFDEHFIKFKNDFFAFIERAL